MNYRESLDYIRSFTDYERKLPPGKLPTDFFLARQAALLRDLGDPQRTFPTIVVAGTKGKGSTCAMLESILRSAGFRVGLWTSPHLHTYRERIQVNRELISPEAFAALVEHFPPVIEKFDGERHGGLPTTFELAFALGMLYFAQQTVDIAVLEVGLGGRYDSANVVTPLISVISSISYDHMAILGNTLAAIAYDKSGIIKPHVPVVTVPQREEAANMIAQVAAEVGAPLRIVADRSHGPGDTGQELASPMAHLSLRGPFQQQNAALATGAALLLREAGWAISDQAISSGLASAQWPGRLELAQKQPFLVLDGAHNGDSAERLAEALRAEFVFRRLILVLGVLRDKDVKGIAAGIVPHADELIVTMPGSQRALDDLDRLAAAAQPHLKGPLHYTRSVADAIRLARSRATADDLICVTGSLTTVADARVALGLALEADEDG